MTCYNHPEVPATAYCRSCGKPLCAACERTAQGTVFCPEHVPQQQVAGPAAAAPVQTPPVSASPGLAFVLGLIPGVGAIYNGQYAKGIIHVVIFGLLITITNAGAGSLEPLLGLLVFIWYAYMPFEAYHTARKRQLGLPVDEFSSIFPIKPARSTGFPIGPVVLILLGVIFLLNTLGVLDFRYVVRFWPVALIALGGYMLYSRLTGTDSPGGFPEQETQHEQQ